MAWKNFDYDVAFQSLIELVEMKLAKASTDREHDFEWLKKYPIKAKEMLERPTEEFKMPKTPARKKRGQQKKRGLTYDEDHLNDHASAVPSKKGKLSNEEDELRESIGSGRPRRQASSAAKSKIQQSLKMNLKQKLRRPSGEEESSNMSVSVHESDVKNQVIEEECLTPPIHQKSRANNKGGNETITLTEAAELGSPIAVDATYTSVEEAAVAQPKVKFAPESKARYYGSCEAELSIQESIKIPPFPVKSVPVEVPLIPTELPKRTRTTRKPKKEESIVELEQDAEPIVRKGKEGRLKVEKKAVEEDIPAEEPETHHAVTAVVIPVAVEEETRTRLTRQSVTKKKDEEEKVQEKYNRQESEQVLVKKNRKVRKPVEEKPVEEVKIVEPSPKKEDKIVTVVEQVASDEEFPVVTTAPNDLTVVVEEKASEEEVKEAESESVLKKKVRKLRKPVEENPVSTILTKSPRPSRNTKIPEPVVPVVSSPRRATRVTAPSAPAAQNSPIRRNIEQVGKNFQSPTASSPVRKMFTPKLVFSPFKPSSVKTKVEAFEAALNAPGSAAVASNSKGVQSVLPEARVLLRRLTREELKDAGVKSSPAPPKERKSKRGTFVTTASTSSDKKSPTDKSVAQVLARKSVEKAKNVALSAARNKLLNSVVQNETAESPSVHLNRNASAIMSKYRFTNTSGSSGSSSANLNRHVAMTQAKTLSNVVTSVSSFTNKPAMVPLVTKSSEDEEAKRKDHELKRLKEKEAEAARKREELIKAKAEEQKRKHEARAKRAMEQRALRAQQIDQEQRQKLENKEEKSANIKNKMLAENQEKAEKVRAALLYRQQEAEQRRKAEELEKQRLWEEEQQRQHLAAKKEQEEKEKQAKLKQAEADKNKTTATQPESSTATAGSSKLNTTVTLLSQSQMANNYQITPVRVTKMGKVVNPDNYDIGDMRSDDSTDDDSRPKKVIPSWARSASLKLALAEQAKGNVDTDLLFPAEDLLQDPNLNKIFNIKRARFDKRTSSAVWKTPPAHYM